MLIVWHSPISELARRAERPRSSLVIPVLLTSLPFERGSQPFELWESEAAAAVALPRHAVPVRFEQRPDGPRMAACLGTVDIVSNPKIDCLCDDHGGPFASP